MANFYKHYIEVDNENWIIKLFSDTFEQPTESSILLRETDQRHVFLGDYVFNPSITEGTQPKYKYVNGEVIEEVKPLSTEQKLVPIRIKRNELLIASDKYMLEDFPVTAEQKVKVLMYRQELRDCTKTIDIDNPIYPILIL